MSPKVIVPGEGFSVKNTSVASPSVVHRKESEQSITASESYYSLSDESIHTVNVAQQQNPSTLTVNRYQTPPSRFRTPQQSHPELGRHRSQDAIAAAAADLTQARKTPMRGFGKRRDSYPPANFSSSAAGFAPFEPAVVRDSGIHPQPAPDTPRTELLAESDQTPTQRDDAMPFAGDAGRFSYPPAKSSMAQQIGREANAPTPDIDDTPYIHFALDQLTRDEEVKRGTRLYPGEGVSYGGQQQPYRTPPGSYPTEERVRPPQERLGYQPVPQAEDDKAERPTTSQLRPAAPTQPTPEQVPQPTQTQEPLPAPPLSASQRQLQSYPSNVGEGAPDLFIAVDPSSGLHQALDFLPAMLRPLGLSLFLLYLLVCTALLLAAAIYSLVRTGLWDYHTIGDGRYFVAQYLPTLLGTILLLWLWQIEITVYRFSPFIAMASDNAQSRQYGPHLPLVPQGFLLPELRHWRAPNLRVVALFLAVAWLQIFTLPLLSSSFNVHILNGSGNFQWIATQAVIWTVIGLYVFLFAVTLILLFWLRRQRTGLLWDPRSLADSIVLLARSNALSQASGFEPAKLGYWRTAARPNEVFYGYGVQGKPARRYSIKGGRIREKLPEPEPRSDRKQSNRPVDVESGRRARSNWFSKQPSRPMVPGQEKARDGADASSTRVAAPWFLRPSFALLWPVVAVILVVAFLIVSYLSSTRLTVDGFRPLLPSTVDRLGFSPTNFLYSFLPALLATFCLLFWVNIDLAYRRLQPLAALNTHDGVQAEDSLLPSYSADLPVVVTVSALASGHFRVALFSFITLVAASLPTLAGGCFWPLFYVSLQQTRVSLHFAGFYALTALTVLYAVSYCLVWPSRSMRDLELPAPEQSRAVAASSFATTMQLVRQSRLLDDVTFYAPRNKVDLVTRLLSTGWAAPLGMSQYATGQQSSQAQGGPAASKVSLADSIRGYGRARQQAQLQTAASNADLNEKEAYGGIARYSIAHHQGRDGKDFLGLDKLR